MKSDNQHLDFLISQYVDGCLEGADKKSVEQKMLNDPGARELYAEHRDVQDLLDDWGNRIPMIDWNDFDKKLDARLEKEVAEQARVSIFRRRLRPVAAAAALLLAAGVGYGWHAVSHGGVNGGGGGPVSPELASAGRGVEIMDMATSNVASHHGLKVEEQGADGLTSVAAVPVTIGPPEDSVAVQSLLDTMMLGLQHVASADPGSVSFSPVQPMFREQTDERDLR